VPGFEVKPTLTRAQTRRVGDDEWIAQAPTNAVSLRKLLADAGVPVTPVAA